MPKIELLLVDRAVDNEASDQTRFGGTPSVPAGFVWPTCTSCSGAMQFLGQLRCDRPERLLSLYMCQNDPGVCCEWDATKGANAVLRLPVEGLASATLPARGDVSRPTRYGARREIVQGANYDTARADWANNGERRQRDVLGQLGGTPFWLDGDETPACDHCNKPMRFTAQLECGPDYETEMNFAGRCGFVFECDCNGGVAKMLY